MSTFGATNPWQLARDAYLAEHPGPSILDFACPRCKAQLNELCAKPDGTPTPQLRFHVGRQGRYVRALMHYRRKASDAADAVVDDKGASA